MLTQDKEFLSKLYGLCARYDTPDRPKDYKAIHPNNHRERTEEQSFKLKAAMENCQAPCCNTNYPKPRLTINQ